jgi:hypothetical protein
MTCHAMHRLVYTARRLDEYGPTDFLHAALHAPCIYAYAPASHPIDLPSLHASSHALVEIATSDVMSVKSSRSCANRTESSDKNALDASIMQIAIGALSTKHVPSLSRMYMVALYNRGFDRCRPACVCKDLLEAFQSFSSTIAHGSKMDVTWSSVIAHAPSITCPMPGAE